MLDFNRLHEFREEVERIFIEFMLRKNGWNMTHTAQELGIQRSHLYNKLERYGIKKSGADDE
ncbi:helix-turn-helix domain-containing protein [uncultured Chitinophaga sp.]|uniref:helix-turn-helix domain-containing protein n=1 Tax=uncultured Chitinophaga sp. TaxID=339340 RepID=UPI0025E06534|nr:helix-turn-helix domain-containing protein [uncultured Chitinophaga sp.]